MWKSLARCAATAVGLLRNIPVRVPDHVGVILLLRPGSVGNVAAPVVSAVPVDKDEVAALLIVAVGKALTPHRRKDAVAAGIGCVVLRGGTKGRFGQEHDGGGISQARGLGHIRILVDGSGYAVVDRG